MNHQDAMHRCLELAARGRREVGNGALVGSVLVRDGTIIAEGYHRGFGKAHAERDLLTSFTGAIKAEDILYVNLEPCCHHGKTPPCTDIIIERGIKHVVIGMVDPDVRVSGEGIAALRKQGITVEGPVLREECEWFNRGFVSVRTKGRPWVTLKSAHTPDGHIAHPDGSPLRITSQAQNAWAHTFLRAKHDAIVVGVQTIINDNPILDARLHCLTPGPSPCRPDSNGRGEKYYPWRIILDPQGRIPHIAKVVSDEHAANTLLIIDPASRKHVETLEENGVQILEVLSANGLFVWKHLWDTLLHSEGKFNGLTSVLVEGGARTWASFRSSGMMDMDITLIG